MSFSLRTVVEGTGGLYYSRSITSEAPRPTFSGIHFGVGSGGGGAALPPSPTYLLGFTLSFVVIGSPQLHAEQLLKTAGPIQNTCEFLSLIVFPGFCQFVFFEVQSKPHSPVSPLMCPEPDVPPETFVSHLICMLPFMLQLIGSSHFKICYM